MKPSNEKLNRSSPDSIKSLDIFSFSIVPLVCNRVLILHEGNLIADGTLDSLKDRTNGSTLEEVFRQMTHTSATDPVFTRVLEALKS